MQYPLQVAWKPFGQITATTLAPPRADDLRVLLHFCESRSGLSIRAPTRYFDGPFRRWYCATMRLIFMGTPEFSVPTLHEIGCTENAVVAVYTRPPKPGGRRGLELKKTPVHEAADSLAIPVFTPTTLKRDEVQDVFRGHEADVVIVVAYGLLLPPPILKAPRRGCLNLHASLLPRWRGAAPVQRAIMAGDTQTGVDLMRMDEGLDTGPIAMREVIPIRPNDTAGDLSRSLAEIAAQARGPRSPRYGVRNAGVPRPA